jgi:peroxiredoxin (alkyl hydroperoxide reductase subunit C)
VYLSEPPKLEETSMALIAAGADAPDFTLESHLETTVSLSDFHGKKNVLLVSYPLDFTPT